MDRVIRVDTKLYKEFIEMKEKRKDITTKKGEYLSDRKITNLIPRHELWPIIKEDICNFSFKDDKFEKINDKRGITFNIFYLIAIGLAGILMFGIIAFIFTQMNAGLDQNVMVGQVNLSNATASTFGVFNTAVLNNLDLWGLFLIFGMVLGLFIASYMLRGTYNKLLIVVDIIILIVVYIFAVVIANSYELLLQASSGVITTFEGNMPKTSEFLLHLPRYTTLIGVIMMILFYSSIPKKEGEPNFQEQGGFQY